MISYALQPRKPVATAVGSPFWPFDDTSQLGKTVASEPLGHDLRLDLSFQRNGNSKIPVPTVTFVRRGVPLAVPVQVDNAKLASVLSDWKKAGRSESPKLRKAIGYDAAELDAHLQPEGRPISLDTAGRLTAVVYPKGTSAPSDATVEFLLKDYPEPGVSFPLKFIHTDRATNAPDGGPLEAISLDDDNARKLLAVLKTRQIDPKTLHEPIRTKLLELIGAR
jgi:hypothetical protein